MRFLMKCAAILAMFVPIQAAQRIKVKIVGRQDSNSQYSYVIPQQVTSKSNTDANCTLHPDTADCKATTNTTATVTPAQTISYSVQGATFSLLLPDGRTTVVNCIAKPNLLDWTHNTFRSCRKPIADEIEVEFNKGNAKLIWPVSIDGKKMESETYKIVGVIGKR